MRNDLIRAKHGDPAATCAVVETLRPRISKMAAHYGRCSGEDSDDLLQEAWLGLLEALPGLDIDIGAPEQYLIARARWRLLDTIKRARVRRCASLDDDPCPSQAGPDQAVATACISEFLSRLNNTQRGVLIRLMAGLTWRETGQSLGCTSANVAYHVKRIRRMYEEWAE